MPLIWADNIENLTKANEAFRTVIRVGKHSELTVMTIEPGSEIGLEVHPDNDQFLRVEAGQCQVKAGPRKDDLSETYDLEADWAFIVPAGTWHNVTNTGTEPLKLYTVYSPANHAPGTVHKTKKDADTAEAAEHGR